MNDSDKILDELTACRQPFLIGVRHHSVAMAKAVPGLLERLKPEIILLELPADFAEWLPWLAHADTVAPVALAGCRSDGADLCFYPFADFSPELAAVRWAFQNDVPVEPFDLPVADRGRRSQREARPPRGLLEHLLRRTDANDTGQLWDRLIESPAHSSSDEQIRRAALLFGWALRWNNDGPSDHDWRREHFMRSRITDHAGKRCAAIVGAYHAAALLPEPKLWDARPPADEEDQSAVSTDVSVATALIPYAFDQLDERSGYPAGIRDPNWHQTSFAAASLADMEHGLVDLVVGVCRDLRRAKHPMNAADAQEVVRVARDLARVRDFATPGRQEVVEALQLCLTQGQIFGAGRAVAAAMQNVLVGTQHGQLPPDLPRCGLAPDVEDILRRLKLPGPESLGTEKRLRLDPLRNTLERAREVFFHRLNVCHIPYAQPAADGSAGDRESLTSVWTVKWDNTTAAMIALSSAKGATLAQAAEGTLRMSLAADTSDWGMAELHTFRTAAECGFGTLVNDGLNWIT